MNNISSEEDYAWSVAIYPSDSQLQKIIEPIKKEGQQQRFLDLIQKIQQWFQSHETNYSFKRNIKNLNSKPTHYLFAGIIGPILYTVNEMTQPKKAINTLYKVYAELFTLKHKDLMQRRSQITTTDKRSFYILLHQLGLFKYYKRDLQTVARLSGILKKGIISTIDYIIKMIESQYIIKKQLSQSLFNPKYKMARKRIMKPIGITNTSRKSLRKTKLHMAANKNNTFKNVLNGKESLRTKIVKNMVDKMMKNMTNRKKQLSKVSRLIANHLQLNKRSVKNGFNSLTFNEQQQLALRDKFPKIISKELERQSNIMKKIQLARKKIQNKMNSKFLSNTDTKNISKMKQVIQKIENDENKRAFEFNNMVKTYSFRNLAKLTTSNELMQKYNKWAKPGTNFESVYDYIKLYGNTGSLDENKLLQLKMNRASYE